MSLNVAAATDRSRPHDQISWNQVWSDSFTGPRGTGVNQQFWKYDTGQGIFGTGEIETMTKSTKNVQVDGTGDLRITAINSGGSWTSGRIQTLGTFAPPVAGEMKITASIKQPSPASGLGYWPAFWLLGPGEWPANGEIDVMEDVDALGLHSGTLHCGNLTEQNGDGTTGPCREYTGITSGLMPCANCQTGYHTYSIIVDRRNASNEQIRWYLDGQQFFAVSEAQIGTTAWTQAVDHGLSIIFDLAIGGSYPNWRCGCQTPNRQTTSGGTMSIHGVTVYDSN